MPNNNKGTKNPNWKHGKFEHIKHVCAFCDNEFMALPHHIFCSNYCANTFQKLRSIINKRLLTKINLFVLGVTKYKPKTGGGNGNSNGKKKIWYCIKCKTAIVNRKTKFCIGCRPKRFELKIKCKYCGKENIKHKGQGKLYCNMECRLKDIVGANNPNYIDGRTPENHKIRNSAEYKEWRTKVFQRDNYTCVWCEQVGGELHVDHIKKFSDYPELRLDVNNGRTLCKNCHAKTDTYMRRG